MLRRDDLGEPLDLSDELAGARLDAQGGNGVAPQAEETAPARASVEVPAQARIRQPEESRRNAEPSSRAGTRAQGPAEASLNATQHVRLPAR
jgi:hypothetical protein